MFTDLTWQIQVLCAETVLGALLGIVLAHRGFRRNLGTMTLFLLWNSVCFALLITGGNDSWQHWTVFGWYVLDTMLVVGAGLQRKYSKSDGLGVAIAAAVLVTALLSLLVTG